MSESSKKTLLQWLVDVPVTLLCWGYFIFAFLFFFSFFYLGSYLFSSDKEKSFQYLNHLFFKGFLTLLRVLSPSHRWVIDPQVKNIRGSIIVCNHLSYLDPLLFLSLLPHNKTIVKTKFFSAPVFGFLLDVSGYLPSSTEGRFAAKMIGQIENMGGFFASGGNLFVFPEGTRNRSTNVEQLHKGVFKIARMYQCPIQVLKISGTDKLFTPGHFFFNISLENQIDLGFLESIEPKNIQGKMTVSILHEKVRQAFLQRKTVKGQTSP
jgi:1-acyl-sn-glycerol-3-phosphate acyltransferase